VARHAQVTIDSGEGAEVFVLQGHFSEGKDQLASQSWLRLPIGSSFNATTGNDGARVWVKTRHLKHA